MRADRRSARIEKPRDAGGLPPDDRLGGRQGQRLA